MSRFLKSGHNPLRHRIPFGRKKTQRCKEDLFVVCSLRSFVAGNVFAGKQTAIVDKQRGFAGKQTDVVGHRRILV